MRRTAILLLLCVYYCAADQLPLVVATWAKPCFQTATQLAYQTLFTSGDRLQAIVNGGTVAELLQCDTSVGYGNHPDESGAVTLDAMIMDGPTHNLGAVSNLQKVRQAMATAYAVLQYTQHSILSGDQADNFAIEMGLRSKPLNTTGSDQIYDEWKANNCQPNYRANVTPNPHKSCGPYKPTRLMQGKISKQTVGPGNHDTIGLIVVDANGDISVGGTTNGMNHKVPGRVADTPLVGAGAYVDNDYGGAAATGDGDYMMRLLPSYQAVENLRLGMNPRDAARDAIQRIKRKFPTFSGAVIVADKTGNHSAACNNIGKFTYSYQDQLLHVIKLKTVDCE